MVLGGCRSFLLLVTTPCYHPEEVKLEIAGIANNKSHGQYSCPPQLLKCSTNIISGVLAKIINSSILNGVFPPKVKMAEVAAVYKADDGTDVNNYQPISLFSHFNGIFEKMIKKKNGILIVDIYFYKITKIVRAL